jgi:hypothetical protein
VTLPLSTTHQLIVGRIFSPSLRHALKRRIQGQKPKIRPVEGGTNA